jgi:hypothetical protein
MAAGQNGKDRPSPIGITAGELEALTTGIAVPMFRAEHSAPKFVGRIFNPFSNTGRIEDQSDKD